MGTFQSYWGIKTEKAWGGLELGGARERKMLRSTPRFLGVWPLSGSAFEQDAAFHENTGKGLHSVGQRSGGQAGELA